MKTQDEINKAATELARDRDINRHDFFAGATFANGYSVEEMCKFAEWRYDNITGAYIIEDDIKRFRLRNRVVIYLSNADLLKLWEESRAINLNKTK